MKVYYVPSITFFVAIILFFSCSERESKVKTENANIKQLNYQVIDTLLHDTTSFTEGLIYYNNKLYESTGSPDEIPFTKSLVGPVSGKGTIEAKVKLERKYFGEGITIFKEKIYQLTYKDQKGFVYSFPSFKKIKEFQFQNKEGWGLTHDSLNLIMSDGTHVLTYLDPNNLEIVKTLNVRLDGYGQSNINELEYVNGFIYANIWQTNQIIKINSQNGDVIALADFTDLKKYVSSIYAESLEMNGIAYDKKNNHFIITGKMWPRSFIIKFL